MTLTSNQLKTIIIELGTPENPNLDTKIMNPARLGTEIYFVQFLGNPFRKGPKILFFLTVPVGS